MCNRQAWPPWMCTPLPITPHHPRESPGSFVRGILVNLQFLECTMQLLQCRLLASGRFTSYTPNRISEIPTISCWAPVLCWGNACINACISQLLSPVHNTWCCSMRIQFTCSLFSCSSLQRGVHLVVLGFGFCGGSENQANHFVLLPISSWRQGCATSMPNRLMKPMKPKRCVCLTMKLKPHIYRIFIEKIKCIRTLIRLENGLMHLY